MRHPLIGYTASIGPVLLVVVLTILSVWIGHGGARHLALFACGVGFAAAVIWFWRTCPEPRGEIVSMHRVVGDAARRGPR